MKVILFLLWVFVWVDMSIGLEERSRGMRMGEERRGLRRLVRRPGQGQEGRRVKKVAKRRRPYEQEAASGHGQEQVL